MNPIQIRNKRFNELSSRMTSIKHFFSPTKTSLAMAPSSPAKSEPKSIHARPDNKLIVSNMKSVINSVKLHKKHKKRKRNVGETPEIHDISNILQSNLSFVSPNRTELEQSHPEITKGQSKRTKFLKFIEHIDRSRIYSDYEI